MTYIKDERKIGMYDIGVTYINDFNDDQNPLMYYIADEQHGSHQKQKPQQTKISHYEYKKQDEKSEGKMDFHHWISFLEKEAHNAAKRKKENKSYYCIVHELRNEIMEKTQKGKFSYIDSLLNSHSSELQVSLPSLFNSIRFIHEISTSIINRSIFFIDQDSLYVNMAFVSKDSRLDLAFKDNGEVSFRFVDCDNGRVRITGSSFFGLGKNEEETKKINKLFNLANKGA